jgi:hypothetical protein
VNILFNGHLAQSYKLFFSMIGSEDKAADVEVRNQKERPSRGGCFCKAAIAIGVALVILGAIVAAILIGRNMSGE